MYEKRFHYLNAFLINVELPQPKQITSHWKLGYRTKLIIHGGIMKLYCINAPEAAFNSLFFLYIYNIKYSPHGCYSDLQNQSHNAKLKDIRCRVPTSPASLAL